jgi:hypothetical protein
MITAYGVKFTRRIKQVRDIGEIFISAHSYYRERDRHGALRIVSNLSEARAMSQACANLLVAKLSGQDFGTPSVIEVITDADAVLPNTLLEVGEERSPESAVPQGIAMLVKSIDQCFSDGMTQLEILAAANKAVLNG